jgi:hypothetical protein
MFVPLPSANPAGHIPWRKEAICGYFPAKERQIKVMKRSKSRSRYAGVETKNAISQLHLGPRTAGNII